MHGKMQKDACWLYASTVLWGSRALAFGVAALASPAHANPVGGTVSAGAATISGQGTPVVQVNQNSDRAVIDWKSFNIAPNETTRFNQPSATSAVLNRIHDQNPSQILGSLSANGQVMLVNPNGMLFGKDSRVDVSGLVATSASISTQSFMSATPLSFGQPGLPDSAVINQGAITVDNAGLAALVAPEVRNEGTITAKTGKVVLASGDTMTLDLYGDQLVSVAASDKIKTQRIDQSGRIEAAGGEVVLTTADAAKVIDRVINMDGWVDVNGLTQEAGSIILHAGGGTANVTGEMHANGTQGWGGKLQITGENVKIGAGALLTASGTTGGGQVLIGGDYLGGGTTPRAKTTIIEEEAQIRANATEQGNGGRVIVWSDERTDFAGMIQAKGGLLSGDGGFVETSSKEILRSHGLVDASAPKGTGGMWLLDPNNIAITTNASANVAGAPTYTTTDDTAVVDRDDIQTSLNGGTSVTITTGTAGGNSQAGNITVTDSITKSAGGAASLSLIARNNIVVNNNISSSSGALNVTLRADSENDGVGGITMTNAAITSNGGNVILGGGADASADEAVGASNSGVQLNNGDISAGAGNISIRGRGRTVAGADNVGVHIHSGSTLQTTSGNITIVGTGGNGTARDHGIFLDTSTITTADGDISLTGIGGDGGDESNGIILDDAARIESTGTGAGAGNIMLAGTAGDGSDDISGVVIVDTSVVTTVDGDIDLTAIGSAGVNQWVLGFALWNNSVISSTGTGAGTITIDATSGTGSAHAYGIYLYDSDITSVDGDIDIEATSVNNAGASNLGIVGWLNSNILSTGTADIAVEGTGGNGTTGNYGILFEDGSRIRSTAAGVSAGNITLTGTGGNGTSNNFGIYLKGATAQITTADGDITLTGTATGGTATNHGIYLDTSFQVTASGPGAITFTGTSNATGTDIVISGGANVIGGASAGDIAFVADEMSFANLTVTAAEDIALKPRTAGRTIHIPSNLVVGRFRRALIAPRSQDL